MDFEISELNKRIGEDSLFVQDLRREMSKVVVGQEELIDALLTGIIGNGHVLLEGLPGLAKTLTIKTLADVIDSSFQRIQFTPDLLPADIVGTSIYNPKESTFSVRKGPIFANIILADEINRAPAKVQSALLEAMQERQVTISENTYKLPELFMVMATQNPIEQEGTYPLPEAQTDRFMLKVNVTYPSKTEELRVLELMSRQVQPTVRTIISSDKILKARQTADNIYVDDKIKNYVLDLVIATREPEKHGLSKLRDYIRCGASPRATIFMIKAAKSYAFINGRGYVTPEDIKAVGFNVMRHRILLTYEAEAENITSEDILRNIFEAVEVP